MTDDAAKDAFLASMALVTGSRHSTNYRRPDTEETLRAAYIRGDIDVWEFEERLGPVLERAAAYSSGEAIKGALPRDVIRSRASRRLLEATAAAERAYGRDPALDAAMLAQLRGLRK
jgi:hypothetical protein